jgi:hypothetical protein
LSWPDVAQYADAGRDMAAPNGSASKLLAWLFPDKLIEYCTARLDEIVGGLSQAGGRMNQSTGAGPLALRRA